MGHPSAKTTVHQRPEKLFSQTVHVPNQTPYCNRKTGMGRSPPHETRSVAPEATLTCTRESGKDYSNSPPLHPHLDWWLEEDNVLRGQPLHPLQYALQIFTDASNEGWGAYLGDPRQEAFGQNQKVVSTSISWSSRQFFWPSRISSIVAGNRLF